MLGSTIGLFLKRLHQVYDFSTVIHMLVGASVVDLFPKVLNF